MFRRVGPHLGPSRRQNEDAEEAGAGRGESEQAGWAPAAGEVGAGRRGGCLPTDGLWELVAPGLSTLQLCWLWLPARSSQPHGRRFSRPEGLVLWLDSSKSLLLQGPQGPAHTPEHPFPLGYHPTSPQSLQGELSLSCVWFQGLAGWGMGPSERLGPGQCPAVLSLSSPSASPAPLEDTRFHISLGFRLLHSPDSLTS